MASFWFRLPLLLGSVHSKLWRKFYFGFYEFIRNTSPTAQIALFCKRLILQELIRILWIETSRYYLYRAFLLNYSSNVFQPYTQYTLNNSRVLTQSVQIPTCFGGGHHHHQIIREFSLSANKPLLQLIVLLCAHSNKASDIAHPVSTKVYEIKDSIWNFTVSAQQDKQF